MSKQLMDIVHNHNLDWLFHQNVSPLRELTCTMSGNCKELLEELFRSPFTEL